MTDFETRAPDWLPFSEALERIVAAAAPLPPLEVPLAEAEGLALARAVASPLTLPPGPTSHMDGYALRAKDLEPDGSGFARPLPVVGTSRPGSPHPEALPPGAAVRVMTGALLPAGADTVVPVEETDRRSGPADPVRVGWPRDAEGTPFPPGRHVRPPGEEAKEGETLASPGDPLVPGRVALLAATGAGLVLAHPSPRVALVVTGDELVPPGDLDALAGGIRKADVLSPTLPSLVRAAGGTPLPPRRAGDDPRALAEGLREAVEGADLLVTTGGASMGETDRVKGVLERMGFRLDFWRIRIRPGSPVSLGRLPRPAGGGERVPVLGLPGNPVSALVTFLVLGYPAIRSLGGHRRAFLPRIRATVRAPLAGPPHLTRFLRVRLEPEGGGRWGAEPAGAQGSGVLRTFAATDGLAIVSEGTEALAPGNPVEVLLLPHPGWPENR